MSRIILNFHGIGAPHAEVPADEVPYWLTEDRYARIVDRAAELRDDGAEIEFTFDDGNRSDIEIAAPRLEAAGMRGRFFVLLGRIDDARYLDAGAIRALARAGHEIGLHGRHHVDWRRLSEAELTDETVVARTELARILDAPVRSVGIPFGAYDTRLLKRLMAQRFDAIYTSDRGAAERSGRVFSRNTLRADMSEAEVEVIMRNEIGLGRRLRRQAGRIVRRHLR